MKRAYLEMGLQRASEGMERLKLVGEFAVYLFRHLRPEETNQLARIAAVDSWQIRSLQIDLSAEYQCVARALRVDRSTAGCQQTRTMVHRSNGKLRSG